MPELNFPVVFYGWGIIGLMICVLRGRKQGETVALFGGIAIVVASCLVHTGIGLTIICGTLLIIMNVMWKLGW